MKFFSPLKQVRRPFPGFFPKILIFLSVFGPATITAMADNDASGVATYSIAMAYIFSAFKAKPDWGLAFSNLFYPHGVTFTASYLKDYLIIGMGVLGTTITPWGQFFISSFAFDKKIDAAKVKFSQFETYWGAFLTDFFSFFMITATAATLYIHNIPLVSGEQAALAIKPFAGELAGTLFALGILNAGFMGMVVVSLSSSYAFAEFFGLSGSLNTSYTESKTFYVLFLGQLVVAFTVTLIPGVTLFGLAVASQALNAMMLPFVFYYLIKLASSKEIMKEHANNKFQNNFAVIATVIILITSVATIFSAIFNL
jgi:Mn2+/Fe2+ NRAMP family transporter